MILAIDPDVTKSGVAVLDAETRLLTLHTLPFAQLLDLIQQLHAQHPTLQVVVEAGWLNKSNWHLGYKDNARIAAAKGNATGRNHEVGRKLIEVCQHWGIDTIAAKPLTKRWRGKDGKITHEELERVAKQHIKRCNQDARDAALLALVYGK